MRCACSGCASVRLRWYRREASYGSEPQHPAVFVEGQEQREYALSDLDVGWMIGCECVGLAGT